MHKKPVIKALLTFSLITSWGLAQNCKLDLTPVAPDILVTNKVKEIKVYQM